MYIDMESRESA